MTRAKRNPDERKHAAIFAAAMDLFLKHGFARTSMDAIAEHAAVTKQTVYAHFRSKKALFTRIVNELAIRHAPPEDLLRSRDMPVELRLYEIGIGFLNNISSREGIAALRLVIAEANEHQKLAQRYYESASRRILEMLGDYLRQESRRGGLHIPVPLDAASHFLAMLSGNYTLRILLNIKPKPSPVEKAAYVRECVDTFMQLYSYEDDVLIRNAM